MALVYMDLVVENEAFPQDAGAIPIGNEKKIVLLNIPLNNEIAIAKYSSYKQLLEKLDFIHCKAFGSGTTILIQINENGTGFILEYTNNPSSYLSVLVSMIGDEIQEIILMAIVTEDGQGGALAFQEKKYITIWSLAKNPAIYFPNAFGIYLEKLKEDDVFSNYNSFKIGVDPSNTLRMTEQGRIRLYTSLGFNIDQGTLVETIYPEGVYSFRHHEQGNVGRLYLTSGPGVDEKCDFIGNIKSHGGYPIFMSSTRATLGVHRDIYCGYRDSFKGDKIMSVNSHNKVVEINPPFGIRKNNEVDIHPLLESMHTGTSFTVLKMAYHMSLIKVPYNKNNNKGNYIKCCDIPDDFIVITLISPGSVLWQDDSNVFDNYMLKTLPSISNEFVFKHIVETHRSTAMLPLYNIQEHNDVFTNAKKTPSKNDPDLFDRQLYRSLLNSITMDAMGRQPIFEIAYPENMEVKLPWTEHRIKKRQFDIQIYTPGMQMFDYTVSRETNAIVDSRGPMDKEQAKVDDRLLRGTYLLAAENDGYSLQTKIDDDPFVNRTTGKFSDYFSHIRKTVPKKEDEKYILFAFGCAPLFSEDGSLPPYELLYELSHRRSVVHTFPKGTRVDDDDFILTAVLNKHILTEHDCSRYNEEELKKKEKFRNEMKSITIDMNTGVSATNSSSTFTSGAGSGSGAATTTSGAASSYGYGYGPAATFTSSSAPTATFTSGIGSSYDHVYDQGYGSSSSSSSSSASKSGSSSYPFFKMNIVGEPTSSTTSSSTPSTKGAGSGQGGGKRKKRFEKTKRSLSRKMATRFRKLRTRKIKSKGLKTRKQTKKGIKFF